MEILLPSRDHGLGSFAQFAAQRAAECPLDHAPGPYFCWTVKGAATRAETGSWPEACLGCAVYRRAELAHWHRRDRR